MKLLTEELLKILPPLYTTENTPPEEVKVILKLFNPCGSATWFITEYDPEERIAFGYVDLFGDSTCAEIGYFSIDELEKIKTGFGLGIERDIYWDSSTTLAEVLRGEKR